MNRAEDCGPGINVATLDWVKKYSRGGQVWELHVDPKDIVIPYGTGGKIRCSEAKIIRKVN